MARRLTTRELLEDEKAEVNAIITDYQNGEKVHKYTYMYALFANCFNYDYAPSVVSRGLGVSTGAVRRAYKRFYENGVIAGIHTPKGGPIKKFSEEQCDAIVQIALTSPRDHEHDRDAWTLATLASTAVSQKIVASVSQEFIRQLMRERGIEYGKNWAVA